jgi:hypothetical protein
MLVVSIVLSFVLSGLGFRWARNLTHRRLRYVDAAQSRAAPFFAGAAAAVVALIVSAIPVVGALLGVGTAIAVGLGVGLGVASASRDIRIAGYRVE